MVSELYRNVEDVIKGVLILVLVEYGLGGTTSIPRAL